MIALILILYKI